MVANPNAPNKLGDTPIHCAAYYGHTEIVKILAPLTDNSNAPYEIGHFYLYFTLFMYVPTKKYSKSSHKTDFT